MTQRTDYLSSDLQPSHPRRAFRDLSQADFIQSFGSGTLRKSHRLGFDVHEAYLRERTQMEWGQGFEIIPRSRVTYSDLKLIASSSLTELGWHAERMIELRPFESDIFVCKQLDIEYANGHCKHGAGILLTHTSAPWIPKGFMIFSMVCEFLNGSYLPARNPF